jgi:predicted short-subunit dehydrogenase-like oxidoreductase (DUF2520 family)
MITVGIIGSGNVAIHLVKAFLKADTVTITGVYARNCSALRGLVEANLVFTDANDLPRADVYLIAVSDDAIDEVSALLPPNARVVAHTSGSRPINSINVNHNRGCFYPLQTFSKSDVVDFSEVPVCIEAEHPGDLEILGQLAHTISRSVSIVNLEQRRALHLAAVFVCNFTNYLYGVGFEICDKAKLSPELLKPLINKTAGKIKNMTPYEAQTGPALRNDRTTIEAHLQMLQGSSREIYQLLTQSIQHERHKL